MPIYNLLMCGRYRLSRRKQIVEEYFDTVSDEPDWTPRYNIAPTQPVPVIRQNPKESRHVLPVVHSESDSEGDRSSPVDCTPVAKSRTGWME
jgi:putative SOS response-associated peptidase YedK